MVFHIRFVFSMITVMSSIDRRVILRVLFRFVKGPTGDYEDDILDDNNILWTPYLYLDVCLYVRLAVGWLKY